MRFNIYALHGFLGNASHFDGFDLPLIAIDLNRLTDNVLNLKEFGSALNQQTQEQSVLLGYSMGGRLALHALLDAPKRWKAAIIVSAHPGLTEESEKQERLKSDQKWLQRFSEDFEGSIKNWNEQPIFSKRPSPFNPKKEDVTEKILNISLGEWSLGKQTIQPLDVSGLPMPILWIAGSLDSKFKKIAGELTFSNSKSRIWIAENAAHRVPWEVKEQFQEQINIFLEGL